MRKAIVVSGRMTSPTTVQLDEPVTEMIGGVEVILQVASEGHAGEPESVFDFLRHLPSGTRTREDIDRRIREERDAWGDR